MKQILETLKKIEAVSSTNGKKVLIAEAIKDPLFVRVVKMALDCGVSYGFTYIVNSLVGYDSHTAEEVLDSLERISKKRGVSDDDIIMFSMTLPDLETAEVVCRIIRRDLRCGAGPALFEGIVKTVPYQRYRSFKYLKDIDFNDYVVAQLKYDGLFSYLDMRDCSFTTRQGNIYNLGSLFNGRLMQSWITEIPGVMWLGEVLVLGDDGKYLPRKESNGIINSFIDGKGDQAKVDSVRYVTWGYVPIDDFNRGYSDMIYADVLTFMGAAVSPGGPVIMSQTQRVRSLQEADNAYKAYRSRKEEGAIVKNASNLKWKNEKSGSKFGVKLKPFAEAEFRIVEAYYGKAGKKYEFLLGGLVVESEEGKIRTKVGMGFPDKDREKGVEWWNQQKGGIVTVQFCDIVHDKTDRATFCLEHSSFIETRFNEKSTANTYEECMEELNNA